MSSTSVVADTLGVGVGSFDVTKNGQASYRIDIEVPKGINGVQPTLAIQYTGKPRNGILGVGWGLRGIDSITRCPRTIAQDRVNGGVNHDGLDRYCFRGQRLERLRRNVTDDRGDTAVEYRTEIEGYDRVLGYGEVQDAHGGASYKRFRVLTRSGRILEYGTTRRARVELPGTLSIHAWMLQKVIDRHGNYYTVTYNDAERREQFVPERIDYTANDAQGVTPFASIRFQYQNRHDHTNRYTAGSYYSTRKLLKRILVSEGTTELRRYELKYQLNEATGEKQLSTVRECGLQGVCFDNAHTFEWTRSAPGWGALTDYNGLSVAQGFATNDTNPMVRGDFNGDEIDDVARVTKTGVQVISYSPSASQWQALNSLNDLSRAQGYISGQRNPMFVGDWDGDGRTDIGRIANGTVTFYRSAVNRWASYPAITDTFTPAKGFGVAKMHPVLTGDWNGDGRTDVARVSDAGVVFRVSTGRGWASYPSLNDFGSARAGVATAHPIVTGDWNGDGVTDIGRVRKDGFRAYISTTNGWRLYANIADTFGRGAHGFVNSTAYPLVTGDFNGDGKTDIARSGPTEVVVRISTGRGFAVFDSIPEIGVDNGMSANHPMVARDFNGDGLDDIARVANSPVWVFTSTGTGWKRYTSISGDLSPAAQFVNPSRNPVLVGDFNGDGIGDILRAGPTGLRTRTSTAVLSKVNVFRDPAGGKTLVTYRFASQSPAMYTRGGTSTYPVQDVSANRYFVYRVDRKQGDDSSVASRYSYAGGKFDVTGRGFLGFSKIKRKDSTGLETTTWYNQTFPLIGREHRRDVNLKNSDVRTSVEKWTWNDAPNAVRSGIRNVTMARQIFRRFELDPANSQFEVNVTSREYDVVGNVVSEFVNLGDGYSRHTVNTYDDNTDMRWLIGRKSASTTTYTSPDARDEVRSTQWRHEADSNLVSRHRIEPNGADNIRFVSAFEYDGFGNLVVQNQQGADIGSRVSRYGYGSDGRFLRTQTNPIGHVVTKQFDHSCRRPTAVADQNGARSEMRYDEFCRLTEQRYPDGLVETSTYSTQATQHAVTKVSNSGGFNRAWYDRLGRMHKAVRSQFDASTVRVFYKYDHNGRVVAQSVPHPRTQETVYWSTNVYDPIGRLVETTQPDGNKTSWTYRGLRIKTTDALGNKTWHARLANGAKAAVRNAQGDSTSYENDAIGNLTAIIDAQGNRVEYSYDQRSRPIEMRDPDLGRWAYRHNSASELVEQTDNKSQRVAFEYDSLGRVVRATKPEGTTTWQWDTAANGKGLLHSARSPGFELLNEYDSFGRVVATTESLNGERLGTRIGYDQFGRVQQLQYPGSGLTVSKNYQNGWLTSIGSDRAGQLWRANTYDARGKVTLATYGNGVQTTRRFNPATGRMTRIISGTGGRLQNLKFGWDEVGRMRFRGDRRVGVEEHFTYDSISRITEAKVAIDGAVVETKSTAYDKIGNITFKSDVGNYRYRADGIQPHAVSEIDTASARFALTGVTPGGSYGYDANGNLVNGGGRQYEWASFNKPTRIQNGQSVVTYRYDHEDSRIEKTANGKITRYVGKLYELTMDATGYAETFHVTTPTGDVQVKATAGGDPVVEYRLGEKQGSTDVIVDAAGDAVERKSYDLWGRGRRADWTHSAGPRWSRSTRGFTGHESDPAAGLINMNARLYDPLIGKFVSADTMLPSITFSEGLNRYSYVYNSGVNYTDPTGHFGAGDGDNDGMAEAGNDNGGDSSGSDPERDAALAMAQTEFEHDANVAADNQGAWEHTPGTTPATSTGTTAPTTGGPASTPLNDAQPVKDTGPKGNPLNGDYSATNVPEQYGDIGGRPMGATGVGTPGHGNTSTMNHMSPAQAMWAGLMGLIPGVGTAMSMTSTLEKSAEQGKTAGQTVGALAVDAALGFGGAGVAKAGGKIGDAIGDDLAGQVGNAIGNSMDAAAAVASGAGAVGGMQSAAGN